ncbi:MAG: cell division ATP-binding protein FtsE [Patescibacteria group bacterium]|nr:MAG: cell division ATP-binding protein FtsE [Patescibacteria group bacterium]
MIKFVNVTKAFDKSNPLFENLNLEIKDNDFVFIIGKSGAGKTTLLSLIINKIKLDDGQIIVDNLKVDKKFNKTDRLRQKIGFVFQDFKLLPAKNIYENIAVSLQILKFPRSEFDYEIKKVLKIVDLEGKELYFPNQLSAGEQQRAAIARAVAGNRPILLADEPTGNLDPENSWKIMQIFSKLKAKRTIVIATHNTDIVNSFQQRVIRLDQGKIISDKVGGNYSL